MARKFGNALLKKGSESVNLKSFHYYDRMPPMQDHIINDGLGNLIALPLQGRALKDGNSAFVDENWNAYSDQWNALFRTTKLSKALIENKIKEWLPERDSITNECFLKLSFDDEKPWEKTNGFSNTSMVV